MREWLKGSFKVGKYEIRNVYLLAGGIVAILAIVAWRMQGTSFEGDENSAATTDEDNADGTTSDGSTANAGWYSASGTGASGVGQVTYPDNLNPTSDSAPADDGFDYAPEESVITTNDEWFLQAVNWVTAHNSNGWSQTVVATALSTYLQSGQLSSQQGAIRDAAIGQFGYPPDRPKGYIAPATPVTNPTTNAAATNNSAAIVTAPSGLVTGAPLKTIDVAANVQNAALNQPAAPTVSNITSGGAKFSTSAIAGASGEGAYHWYLNGNLVAQSSGPSTTYSFLNPSTKYSVSVAAHNPKGEGPLSAGTSFTTPKSK